MKLAQFLRPDTLPHAIVVGSVVLALAAVLFAFIKKKPFYSLIVVLALILLLLVRG